MPSSGAPPIPGHYPDGDGRVRLRRLHTDDLDWLVGFETDETAVGEHNWPGAQDPDEYLESARRRLERDGWIGPLDGQLVIEVRTEGGGYTPAGTVGWHPRRWGPQPESTALVLGFAIQPEFRGRGVGLAAHRLIVQLLFDATGVNRIEADTAVDNPAELRCLDRAGFRLEGTIRGAELRSGHYIDHHLFAVLREDHEPS